MKPGKGPWEKERCNREENSRVNVIGRGNGRNGAEGGLGGGRKVNTEEGG